MSADTTDQEYLFHGEEIYIVFSPIAQFSSYRGGGERYTEQAAYALSQHMKVMLLQNDSGTPVTLDTDSHSKGWSYKLLDRGAVVWTDLKSLDDITECMNMPNVRGIIFSQPYQDLAAIRLVKQLKRDVPVVFTSQGSYGELAPYAHLLHSNTRQILCVEDSEFSSRVTTSLYPLAMVHVCYGGIHPPKSRSPVSIDEVARRLQLKTLTYVGRTLPHKGIETIIQAGAMLRDDWRVMICTSVIDQPYCDYLNQLAQQTGINIEWRVNLDDAELERALEETSIAVCSSVETDYLGQHYVAPELLGITFLEHVSRGVPLLVSDIPAYVEVAELIHGDEMVYQQGNAVELSSAIQRVLQQPEQTARVMNRMYSHLGIFSWEHYAKNMSGIFSNFSSFMNRGRLPVFKTTEKEHSGIMMENSEAICTVVSINTISFARTLVDSFLKYHPNGRAFVLIVDDINGLIDPKTENFEVIQLKKLAIYDVNPLSFKYTAREFCWCLKPFFIDYVLSTYNLHKVLFFDSDILITSPLTSLYQALDTDSILLTPHVLSLVPEDDLRPNEADFLLAGAYNSGFLGVSNSDEARGMLAWWKARLRHHCIVELDKGLNGDGKWLDLVPSLFYKTRILTDKQYNVAYWNLHERKIQRQGEQYMVNGSEPMVFYHFSGFRYDLEGISLHQNRFTFVDNPDLYELFHSYRSRLDENGYQQTRQVPYGYDFFDNGTRIPEMFRRIYHGFGDRKSPFGDPFKTSSNSFFNWLMSPVNTNTMIPNCLYEIYKTRPDLKGYAPDCFGSDEIKLLRWAHDNLANEYGFSLPINSLTHITPSAPVSAKWSSRDSRKLKKGIRKLRSSVARLRKADIYMRRRLHVRANKEISAAIVNLKQVVGMRWSSRTSPTTRRGIRKVNSSVKELTQARYLVRRKKRLRAGKKISSTIQNLGGVIAELNKNI